MNEGDKKQHSSKGGHCGFNRWLLQQPHLRPRPSLSAISGASPSSSGPSSSWHTLPMMKWHASLKPDTGEARCWERAGTTEPIVSIDYGQGRRTTAATSSRQQI
jgi:hypothetical protein